MNVGARDCESRIEAGRRRIFSTQVRFFAEVASVVTIIAFLAASFIFSLVFATVGANFLEVASIDDVIREGVSLLLLGVSVTFVTGSLFILMALIAELLLLRRTEQQKSRRLFGFMEATVLVSIDAAAYLEHPVAYSPQNRWVFLFDPLFLEPQIWLSLLVASVAAWIWIRRWRSTRAVFRFLLFRLKRAVRLWPYCAYIGGVFALLVTWHSSVASLEEGQGYVRAEDAEFAPGCRVAKVIWAGSQSAVLDCNHDLVVLKGYENLSIIKWPRSFCTKLPAINGNKCDIDLDWVRDGKSKSVPNDKFLDDVMPNLSRRVDPAKK